MRMRTATIAVTLAVLMVPMLDCGGQNPSPVTRPQAVVTTANGADLAIKAADIALTAIEAMTPNPIPRKTTIAIAKGLEAVGKGGQSLATILDAYVKSRGANDWTKVTGAILGIQQTLDAALVDVPEPTRTQVRGILQPVTAALLTILANLPLPGTPSASLSDINLEPNPSAVCPAGQVLQSWSFMRPGLIVGLTCAPKPGHAPDPSVQKYLDVRVSELFIDQLVASETIGDGGRLLVADTSALGK